MNGYGGHVLLLDVQDDSVDLANLSQCNLTAFVMGIPIHLGGPCWKRLVFQQL